MKRLLVAALFSAVVLISLSIPAAAQTTRTYSLGPGDTINPASRSYDPSGATAFSGGIVAGQLNATPGNTFSLSLSFRSTGLIDEAAGIYGGEIVAPFSSFVISQASGRKSVSTSGTIDSGTVTYRLTPYGQAEIISVLSNNLTVWEGKNKSRRAIGTGTLDWATAAPGVGTMTLSF